MSKIISVSRRTDVPTFYGDWFLNRVKEGFVGYVNPFGGQKYLISLRLEDVICFVFWSKNYAPFIDHLKTLQEMGYKFYFNYTITGLPNIFECNLVSPEEAIDTLKDLSDLYSPKHINWRYDPIVISSITDYDYHLKNFENIASTLHGYVERCYFSYAIQYGKVERNFNRFEQSHNIKIFDPDIEFKIKLATQLAEIAEVYGISMQTCCGDLLISSKIQKAHCIDGNIIEDLFFKGNFEYIAKPTREECGCTESTDVGTYDSCPHGCIYCYANINKDRAQNIYKKHDVNSAFLGYAKQESDPWLRDIETNKKDKEKVDKQKPKQLSMFG